VVGHRGMLGHVVARYFVERGYDVRTSDVRYTGSPRDDLVEAIRDSGAHYVVNCLGRTQRDTVETTDLLRGNTVFPLHLVHRLRPEQFLFHASSDGVFSGMRGSYCVDDEPDSVDSYGFSKVLGEAVAKWPNVAVIRVSIVGPDEERGRGLLTWFLSRPSGQPLNGFTNRYWNGITTLEWAKVVEALIARRETGETLPPVVQPGTEVIDKYRLLCTFRDAFRTQHVIRPVETEQTTDLSLVPTMHCKPIREELDELIAWMEHRKAATTGVLE
jgi:dTDP-4-dehydrorhamnose reductase